MGKPHHRVIRFEASHPSSFLFYVFLALTFHFVVVPIWVCFRFLGSLRLLATLNFTYNNKKSAEHFLVHVSLCGLQRPPIKTAQVFLFICLRFLIHKCLPILKFHNLHIRQTTLHKWQVLKLAVTSVCTMFYHEFASHENTSTRPFWGRGKRSGSM